MFKVQKPCCGCSACVAICPKKCLEIKQDSKGFYVPAFDPTNCINCDLCVKVCPLNKEDNEKSTSEKAFGAVANDCEISETSSSGGLFTLLCNKVLEKNGVVFGAAFDENFNVYHKAAYSFEEAKAFRGSKYVQSNVGNCFKQVKELLENDRFVYFSGTPCQVAGLVSYLKKDYDKLITQDFICHSVPSPLIWDSYKAYRQEEFGGKITNVSFRAKEKDKKGYKLLLTFDNGKKYMGDGNDPYMKAFIEGLSSNSSCISCKFKGNNRYSDITLGDFWGVEDICEDFNDYNGVSLVLLHSEKALSLFEAIKKDVLFVVVSSDKVFNKNQMAVKSVYENPKRKVFLKHIKKKGFNKAYKKATKAGIKQKLKRTIKKLFI